MQKNKKKNMNYSFDIKLIVNELNNKGIKTIK